jgi:molybdenum cofactor cytidylyltransferase
MISSSENYGVVLLAAGKSSRLGQPKQLLVFEENTLVKRATEIALQVTSKIIVVTGSEKEKVDKELSQLNIVTVFNKNYEEGIASSICTGLASMQESFPGIKGVILMVCDQPYVSSILLRQLIEKKESTEKPIVACSYNDTVGTPALFAEKSFPLLLQLTGGHGAKKIIQDDLSNVVTIHFPEGAIDIDTKEDYELINRN